MGSINMNKTKIAVMLGALSSFGAQASLIIDGDAQSNGGKVTATVGVVESVKPEAVKPAPQVKAVVKEAVKQEVKEFKGVPETKMGKHFSMSSMENSGVAPKPVVKKEEVKATLSKVEKAVEKKVAEKKAEVIHAVKETKRVVAGVAKEALEPTKFEAVKTEAKPDPIKVVEKPVVAVVEQSTKKTMEVKPEVKQVEKTDPKTITKVAVVQPKPQVITPVAEPKGYPVQIKAQPFTRVENKMGKTWVLKKTQTLRENIAEWAKKSGWELVWNAPDYRVVADTRLTGEIDSEDGPIITILKEYEDSALPLKVSIYGGNRVISVEGRNYQGQGIDLNSGSQLINSTLEKGSRGF